MKLPWMKFYPSDWFADVGLQACSALTRGVWFDLLMRMHGNGQTGVLSGTVSNFASWGRCTEEEAVFALDQLRCLNVASVTCNVLKQKSNDVVTVANRRMQKAFRDRINTNVRVRRYRDKNHNVTPEKLSGNAVDVRSQMSDVIKEEEKTSKKEPPADAAPRGAVRSIRKHFSPPNVSEVELYMSERKWADVHNKAMAFCDFYESKGWKIGKVPMCSWQASVRTWERNGVNRTSGNRSEQTSATKAGSEQWDYSGELK